MNRFPGDGEKCPSNNCPAVMGMTAMMIEARARTRGVEPDWHLSGSDVDGCKVGSRMNRRKRKKGGHLTGS